MAIIKRTSINDTIFKELKEKYPPVSENNGVAYKQKLDYLTFETDFMSDNDFRELRSRYGNDIIAVIFYVRTKMCENGWKVRMDGNSYKCLVNDCSYYCNIAPDKVNAILQDLIHCHILFSVQDESCEEGQWLTCPQQIYNYEMACNNRQQSRARNAKKRARQEGQNNPFSNPSPTMFEPFGNTSNEAPASTDDPFGLFSN